jgi:hypothetical protein
LLQRAGEIGASSKSVAGVLRKRRRKDGIEGGEFRAASGGEALRCRLMTTAGFECGKRCDPVSK